MKREKLNLVYLKTELNFKRERSKWVRELGNLIAIKWITFEPNCQFCSEGGRTV